ncbi:MAG: hypothetical protein WCG75_11450, partial [Armatimonadota bacterium]
MRQKLISFLWVALGAIATGTMLVLALPLGEQAWLAWFMLVPLLIATKEKGFLVGFLGGLAAVFWCGLLANIGVFYHAKNFEPDSNWTYSGCGLFGIVFSVFFAIWADRKNHEKSAWWFAALAVCLESILLIILPAPLAITQYRNPIMMVVASGVGIWGVSFLVWFLNVACLRSNGWRSLTGLVAVVSWLATFTSSIALRNSDEGKSGEKLVGVVQIGDAMEKELLDSHHSTSEMHPEFIVWPEFSGMMFVRGEDTSKILELSQTSSPIITSFRDTFQPFPHNVASLFENGLESNRYEKRKLFGAENSMHTAGTKAVAVKNSKGMVIGLNICYDSCFPYIIRETAALPGVSVIALPTIDPDSRHYFIAGMHAAFTPFRCPENGVAMVRSDGHFGSMI